MNNYISSIMPQIFGLMSVMRSYRGSIDKADMATYETLNLMGVRLASWKSSSAITAANCCMHYGNYKMCSAQW